MSEETSAVSVHSLSTVRTGRYAMLGARPHEARQICFVLHGYGQLATTVLKPFLSVVPADTCVVAPEGLSRFYREMPRPDGGHLKRVGANWMTSEARLDDIADTMNWLDRVHDEIMPSVAAGAAVMVIGFSQGVAAATRWIARGRVKPDAFVVWAGGPAAEIDDILMAERLRDASLLLVAGDSDPFVSAEAMESLRGRLRVWKLSFETIGFQGDHRMDTAVIAGLLARHRGS